MPNRLAAETSPYLLQHAHNPVDWYPWGPEALARAKAEDRPILLSVGYSACHWCHVMERESFEDASVAAEMNRDFVNIKVDREERPDLDEIYMRAVQAFTGGHGGWPMTVFLTPDGAPFFGGTYFPPAPRGGMPSFRQVLAHATRLYRERKDQIAKVSQDLRGYLDSSGRMPKAESALSDRWLAQLSASCEEDFDAKHGGFGGAPKFPPHAALAALLAAHHRSGDRRALEMATRTLDEMARGGMYDLAGGGFARYSVDERWLIPHFEKMLYDNAQLVPVYVDAWKITGRERYARVVRETLAYVLRDLCAPDGAFYASEDADSEGEEGRFYVWTPRQLREVLGVFDGTRAAVLLEVTDQGSFEHGTSALRLEQPWESLPEADRALLDRALPALLAARSTRVRPGRDEKRVTAWNALMISAFARAGAAMGEPAWVDAARRAMQALLRDAVSGGRLLRLGQSRRPIPAFLDDHAVTLQALLDLYEADADARWLAEALRLADQMVALFWDQADGGFFYTGSDAEPLITRSKHMLGGAEPSGNGVAALSLLRLEALCGRADLGVLAERVLRSYQPLLQRAPRALGVEAIAGAWRSGSSAEIGVVGEPGDPATEALLSVIRSRYLPFAVVARVSPSQSSAPLPWMEGRGLLDGRPSAWVCEGGACRLPTTDAGELSSLLDELSRPRRELVVSGRDRAPALPAERERWLHTDTPLTLDRLRGSVVVLDFFTYCCVNCMHVLPELEAVERAFAGQPVVVIGVHSAKFTAEKVPANVARALARHHVRHPVVLDPDHAIWDQYAVRAWPTLVVLDAEGRIAWRQSGEVERGQLAARVEQLLDEGRERGVLGAPVASPAAEPRGTGLRFPGKVAVWPDNQAQASGVDPFSSGARLYVADTGNHRVLEAALTRGMDGWPRATVLRVFGDGRPGLVDGEVETARFRGPQGLSRLGRTLWVADTENHALRAIDLERGEVRTVAGTGELGRGRPADPRDPRRIALRSPWDVAATADQDSGPDAGAVFVAMAGSHQIWVYLPERDHIGPFVGSGREEHEDGPPGESCLAQPSGLSLYGRFLFIADSEVSSVRVFDLQENMVGTLCGGGLFEFGDVDGEPEHARLQHPLGVAVLGDTVYVADTFNHKIKRMSLSEGRMRSLVGGSPEILCEPGGLAVLGDWLVVADTNNHRIRVVHRRSGEIRDLALADLPEAG